MTKRCTRCGIEKPLTGFHKSRSATGARSGRGGQGVAAVCRDCRAEARKPGLLARRAARAEAALQGLRSCGTCKEIKPIASFHVRRASTDGLAYKCADCVKEANVRWREDNPGAFQAWYAANKERRANYWRGWYEKNKVHRSASYAAWAKKSQHIINAIVARRTAAKLRATPKWADPDAIREFYSMAAWLTAETGVKHEVDHIYPLQGKSVCGLHCEANLQVLTKTENIRKSNRMPEGDHEPRRRGGPDEGNGTGH